MPYFVRAFTLSSSLDDILAALKDHDVVSVLPFMDTYPLEYIPMGIRVDPVGSRGRDWLVDGTLARPGEGGRFGLGRDTVHLALNSQTGTGKYGNP